MGTMLPSSLRGPEPSLPLPSLDGLELSVPDHLRPDLERGLRELHRGAGAGSAFDRESASLFAAMRELRLLAADRAAARPGADYPDTEFSRSLQQVAQLIRADVGLEVACVDLDGWDTHEEQRGVHATWPTLAPDALDDGDLAITTDFRDVLSEILVRRLQNPAVDRVFPGYRATYRGIVGPSA